MTSSFRERKIGSMLTPRRNISTKLLLGAKLLLVLHIVASHSASQSQNPKVEALYRFPYVSASGAAPVAALVIGKSGSLFGTPAGGAGCGAFGYGTVFELSPHAASGGGWTETVLYSFTGQNGDGRGPSAGLVFGRGGVLYGTTAKGGGTDCGDNEGCGTVFELTPPATPAGPWTETVLHQLTGQNGDGYNPEAGLVIGPGGALYGSTESGGISSACSADFRSGCGTVFQLSPAAGGAWTEATLYQFTGQNGDGSIPRGNLVVSGGVIYGTTLLGGTGPCDFEGVGCGTVFELSPPSVTDGVWTEKVLYSFVGPNGDGAVIVGDGGVLYGTTAYGGPSGCGDLGNQPGCGTVFEVTPPATPGRRLDRECTSLLYRSLWVLQRGWVQPGGRCYAWRQRHALRHHV